MTHEEVGDHTKSVEEIKTMVKKEGEKLGQNIEHLIIPEPGLEEMTEDERNSKRERIVQYINDSEVLFDFILVFKILN